jgi:para-aminobenzoate synthetase component 1
MAAQPSRRWVTVDGNTRIMDYQYPLGDRNSSSENQNSTPPPYLETIIDTTKDNALTLINQVSQELTQHYQNDTPHNLPFTGGILAYFSYELGRRQSNIAQRSPNDCKLPEMVAGLYEWAVVQDHEVQTSYLVALPSCSPSLISAMKQRLDSSEDAFIKNEESSSSFSSVSSVQILPISNIMKSSPRLTTTFTQVIVTKLILPSVLKRAIRETLILLT